MAYNAKVTLKFDSTWSGTSGVFDELLPEEHITIEAPAEDLNTTQLFELFKKFMFAMGYAENSIASGACHLAFNDMRSPEYIKRLADEYDLIMKEDYQKKHDEYDAQQDEDIKKLEAEIRELKAKLGEILPETYGKPSITKETLCNAYQVCNECGIEYGTYSVGCSSRWVAECDVCGEIKPVTEARDYGFLKKGIVELSE
jgi:hypothetical protein